MPPGMWICGLCSQHNVHLSDPCLGCGRVPQESQYLNFTSEQADFPSDDGVAKHWLPNSTRSLVTSVGGHEPRPAQATEPQLSIIPPKGSLVNHLVLEKSHEPWTNVYAARPLYPGESCFSVKTGESTRTPQKQPRSRQQIEESTYTRYNGGACESCRERKKRVCHIFKLYHLKQD